MNALSSPLSQLSLSQVQSAFLDIQPRIMAYARSYFRHHQCAAKRADYSAEVVALCWQWFGPLLQRGKDPRCFVSILARYASRAVQSGRRLCGQLKARDALSERAQRRHGFRVEPLPTATRVSFADPDGQQQLDTFEERLQDNTQTPIPEQVAFRCDFREWLRTRSHRDRRLIRDLAHDERVTTLARKYQITPGRVSQLRRDCHDDWERFCADSAEKRPADAVLARPANSLCRMQGHPPRSACLAAE
jgi:hypothetical protein